MAKNQQDLEELTKLINKFIGFADNLREEGKINEEQYTYLTKNKIQFLREARENEYNSKSVDKAIIKNDLYY